MDGLVSMNMIAFTLTFVGALFLFVDWVLGRQNQRLLKKRVRWWFYHVHKASFRGLLNEDAALLRKFAGRWLGDRWYSPSVPIFVLLISAVCVVAFIESILIGPFWEAERLVVAHALTVVPINVFFAWISYLVTLRLLRVMEHGATLLRVTATILLDAALAVFFVFLTVDSFIFWSNIEYAVLFDRNYEQWSHAVWLQAHLWLYVQAMLMSPLSPIFDAKTLYWGEEATRIIQIDPRGVLAIPLIMVSVSVIPTLAHILVGLAFVMSKAFRPILRPTLSLVLVRLAQSKTGVLTVIGTGLMMLGGLLAAWPQAMSQSPA